MSAAAIAKTAITVIKNRDNIGKIISFLAVATIGLIMALVLVCMSLISAFTGNGLVNSKFDASKTSIYKKTTPVYEEYMQSVQDEMDEIAKQIIKDNTKTETKTEVYIDTDGKLKTRTITETIEPEVITTLNYINHAYLFAYLSVVDDVKINKKFKLTKARKKIILEFYKAINSIETKQIGDMKYLIENKFMTSEEVANHYFTTDVNNKDRQMFLLSFQTYETFFGINITSGRGTDTTDSPGGTEIAYGENGMEIPLYLQYSGSWANKAYGDGTIAQNGCAVTALAMVMSYLKANTILPDDIVNFVGNKYYVNGTGSSWGIFSAVASHYQVSCSNLGMSKSSIISELQNGHPVIVSMGPGTFTKGGHFIVLRGITADGKVLVNDPNDNTSKNFVSKEFDLDSIISEAKNFWSFG